MPNFLRASCRVFQSKPGYIFKTQFFREEAFSSKNYSDTYNAVSIRQSKKSFEIWRMFEVKSGKAIKSFLIFSKTNFPPNVPLDTYNSLLTTLSKILRQKSEKNFLNVRRYFESFFWKQVCLRLFLRTRRNQFRQPYWINFITSWKQFGSESDAKKNLWYFRNKIPLFVSWTRIRQFWQSCDFFSLFSENRICKSENKQKIVVCSNEKKSSSKSSSGKSKCIFTTRQ